MIFENFIRRPEKFRVALLGIGRANCAVLDWLLAAGCSPAAFAESTPHTETLARLRQSVVPFSVGAFPARIDADVLVRSPALRPDLPMLTAHRRAGGPVVEESAITRALLPCHLIGVTGSDGKTTTAALTAALLAAAGKRVWLGGNNGVPLLGRVGEMTADDVAVMELSSFQLMDAPRAADTAVITNIAPNHLNWHTDMAEYIAAKRRICDGNSRLITNAACNHTRALGLAHGRTVFFALDGARVPAGTDAAFTDGADVVLDVGGSRTCYPCLRDFQLAGKHNQENLLAAIAAASPWLHPAAVRRALPDFHGVTHRLQYIATVDGVRYIDSSIDTSPTRTAAALSALACKPIVIAGGRGKGVSLLPLCKALRARASAVCLYGETAEEIAVGLCDLPHSCHVRFADAFAAAVALAGAGDTVLLSPGCTAFGEFRDFEERGNCFRRLVEALAAERK